jgi:hypothetical protein
MATLEEIKEMLGDEFPDDLTDEIYEKEYLRIMNRMLAREGEQWVRDHRVLLKEQWIYVRTLC